MRNNPASSIFSHRVQVLLVTWLSLCWLLGSRVFALDGLLLLLRRKALRVPLAQHHGIVRVANARAHRSKLQLVLSFARLEQLLCRNAALLLSSSGLVRAAPVLYRALLAELLAPSGAALWSRGSRCSSRSRLLALLLRLARALLTALCSLLGLLLEHVLHALVAELLRLPVHLAQGGLAPSLALVGLFLGVEIVRRSWRRSSLRWGRWLCFGICRGTSGRRACSAAVGVAGLVQKGLGG